MSEHINEQLEELVDQAEAALDSAMGAERDANDAHENAEQAVDELNVLIRQIKDFHPSPDYTALGDLLVDFLEAKNLVIREMFIRYLRDRDEVS